MKRKARRVKRFFRRHGNYIMVLLTIGCVLFLVGFFNTLGKHYFATKRVEAAEERLLEFPEFMDAEKRQNGESYVKSLLPHAQTYVVKSGDSFYSIAEKYIERFDLSIDPATLARKIEIQNHLTDSEFHLQPGTRLQISFY